MTATYQLITGNSGTFDFFSQSPISGTRWKLVAERDEDGQVSAQEVQLVAPDGKPLCRLKITLDLRKDVRKAIEAHLDQKTEPGAAGPQDFDYRGTTGSEAAAGMLRYVQTGEWSLNVAFVKMLAEDHVQLLDHGKVITNVDVEPKATLPSRVMAAINDHRKPKEAPAEPKPPLICVDPMPTGSWLVTLWLTGVQLQPSEDETGPDGADHYVRNPAGYTAMLKQIDDWLWEHPNAKVQSPDVDLDELRTIVAARMTPGTPEAQAAAGEVAATVMAEAPPEEDDTTTTRVEGFERIPIEAIVMGANQRSNYDHGKLHELAASIRKGGVRQPILVTLRDGEYRLVAGARRVLASKIANVPDIPAMVREQSELDDEADQLIENIQRDDISPIDEARAYRRVLNLIEDGTPGDVAARVGRSRPHVVEYLQLLDLPDDLQHQVDSGALGVKGALAYLIKTKNDPDHVKVKAAAALVEEQPSVRKAGEVIDRVRQEEGVARATPSTEQPAPEPEKAAPAPEASQIPAQNPAPAETPAEKPEDKPVAEPPSQPAPVTQTEAPTERPAASHARDLQAAAVLSGRWLWPNTGGEWLFDKESYITPGQLGDHWDARKKRLAEADLPDSFGVMQVRIPTQGIFILGPEFADDKVGARSALVEIDGAVWVRLSGGRIFCLMPAEFVYYRVGLKVIKDSGEGTYTALVQQAAVVDDGTRHVLIHGKREVHVTIEDVQAWQQLIEQLPGMPAE